MDALSFLTKQVGMPALRDARDLMTRRRMLMGGLLAAAWTARPAKAAPRPSPVRWLVNHLTMGVTEAELALAETLGYFGYLEYQLNHTAIDDSAFEQRIADYTIHQNIPDQILNLPSFIVTNQLIDTTIMRGLFSQRQLYARAVEFWTEHFNIYANKGLCPWFKIHDDRDVIRAHALGKFPDMVLASMKSPSMLIYLDNFTSMGVNPNENYARELMELHTLGVNGGYTQTDVQEVARCLTGWTLYDGYGGSLRWTFRYDASRHDDGPKTVLGNAIPAGGGMNDGLIVHDILTTHPSTAQFLSRKMCSWFYANDPPQSLVDSVAATYTATGGDIKSMIRTLFSSADPAAAPLKYKRPYHLFISAMRAVGAELAPNISAGESALRIALEGAGQEPFFHVAPDGYPDTLDAWVGLMLPRWNFAFQMVRNLIDRVTFDVNAFLQGASTPDAIVSRIDAALFGSAMSAAEKQRIRDYLNGFPMTEDRQREAVALAICSPGFQQY